MREEKVRRSIANQIFGFPPIDKTLPDSEHRLCGPLVAQA
jgi:hypothetical protein